MVRREGWREDVHARRCESVRKLRTISKEEGESRERR